MQAGDRFCVTDGKGSLYDGELVEAHPKRATVCLTNKRPGYDNKTFKLEIAIAPTKLNERTEWFLEKATEIGIDKVQLFASYHSERRVANVERFRKVMIAAMKQSITRCRGPAGGRARRPPCRRRWRCRAWPSAACS